MGGYRTIFVLIAIMAVVALVIGGVAIGVLYDTAFEQRRAALMQTAQSQARLIEAAMRHQEVENLEVAWETGAVDREPLFNGSPLRRFEWIWNYKNYPKKVTK